VGQEQRSRGKKVEAGAERRGSGRARSKEARGLGMLRRRKSGKKSPEEELWQKRFFRR
jgi:hypothetical protein